MDRIAPILPIVDDAGRKVTDSKINDVRVFKRMRSFRTTLSFFLRTSLVSHIRDVLDARKGERSVFTSGPWTIRLRYIVLLSLSFYVDYQLVKVAVKLYNKIRNSFGSMSGKPETAYKNALLIIGLEKLLFLYAEERMQNAVLRYYGFIKFWNTFYLATMFPVVLAVLFGVFVFYPGKYQECRNTFLLMNFMALGGYALFPLMPPRLISACDNKYGVCQTSFKFCDTLRKYPNFTKRVTKKIWDNTNHYAAMPSMHIGYAYWTAHTVSGITSNKIAKVTAYLFPLAMLYCIVVTGNHFFLDALGGICTFHVASKFHWLVPRIGRGALIQT